MRSFEVSRYALSISAAAAFLSACGGSSIPIRTTDNAIGDAGGSKSKTFHYTAKEQQFVVPPGVRRLTVVARGAEGGGFAYYPSSNTPGLGGRVYAVIRVHPGEKLYVFVGGSGLHGGFNGGAAGGSSRGTSAAPNPGGGASDVRMPGDTLQDRIIVAGGGGGAGIAVYTYGTDYGGNGGGLTGQSGGGDASSYTANGGGGGGGTQSVGGSGGASGVGSYNGSNGQPGANGALGLGGNGGNSAPYDYAGGGGGGGGGYYGGGGGGGGGHDEYSVSRFSSEGGGGGGGSSYVEPRAITSRMWTGWKKANGDGQVVLSWN